MNTQVANTISITAARIVRSPHGPRFIPPLLCSPSTFAPRLKCKTLCRQFERTLETLPELSIFVGSHRNVTGVGVKPLLDVAATSAEADVQRRQAEDLPATGLRGDDDDTCAGRGVQRLDPAAVLDVCAPGGRHDRGRRQPHRVASDRTGVARPGGGESGP